MWIFPCPLLAGWWVTFARAWLHSWYVQLRTSSQTLSVLCPSPRWGPPGPSLTVTVTFSPTAHRHPALPFRVRQREWPRDDRVLFTAENCVCGDGGCGICFLRMCGMARCGARTASRGRLCSGRPFQSRNCVFKDKRKAQCSSCLSPLPH